MSLKNTRTTLSAKAAKALGLLVLLITAIPAALSAQSLGNFTGRLVDAKTGEGIIGAIIELKSISKPDNVKYFSTERDGVIKINNIEYGQYDITASFIGYKDINKRIDLNSFRHDLGTLKIREEAIMADAIVVSAPALRTSQKGDTVVYNASAFKVAADADTEGLLAKMPGVTVSNGSVEAQGEQIQKVFVDGKEFFGEDVTSALKNLPAEVVEKIEVFNKQSDRAEFTGIDDGEGYKAINIVTAPSKRRGQFGKLYAGYGWKDKYMAGGNINFFSGDRRISVIGLVNNINQQNFAFEDILGVTNTTAGVSSNHTAHGFMVRPQDGVATAQSIGINYSDQWGKKVEATASYFFNHTSTLNDYTRQTWSYNDLDNVRYNNTEGNSRANNYNHRFNSRIEYKINENNTLLIRPGFSYQKYGNYDEKTSKIDSLIGNTTKYIQESDNKTESTREGYFAYINALYRVKLGKPGRTLSINARGNYRKNDRLSLQDQNFRFDGKPDSVNNKKTITDTYSYMINGTATYTEPINSKSQLSVEYRATYNYSDADRSVYKWLEDLALYDDEIDEALSNIYNSGYLTHRAGPGYNYADKKFNMSASVMYQYSYLSNHQLYPVSLEPFVEYGFNNIVYNASANFNFNPTNTLRITARSYTTNPSVTQLQATPDFSDLQNISSGNSELKPSYNNRFNANYSKSNVEKGRTLNISLNGSFNNNYIADSTVTTPGFEIPNSGGEKLSAGAQYRKPVNLNGYWRTNLNVGYGFPVKFLRSNLTVNAGATIGETPSIINGDRITMTETNFSFGATLGSNISENIDFTISYMGAYNISRKAYQGAAASSSNYISHNANANVKWIIWQGITFTGSISYVQNRDYTNNYNEEYLLCNMYLGKKIFRNRRGEISIGVNDLFDQNKSYRRTVTALSIQNSTNSAIGRYYAINFVYNLRMFGGNSAGNESRSDGARPRSGTQGGPGGDHS